MLAILSPAKSLDYNRRFDIPTPTQPRFKERTDALVLRAKGMTVDDLMAKMHISQALAILNHERWQNFWQQDEQPAIQVFDGDVYTGLNATTMKGEEFLFAQRQLRMLSGLYGILRPMDLMRPYRLEMGTKRFPADSKLSIWWDSVVAKMLAIDIVGVEHETGDRSLLNLASQEYYAAVKGQLPKDIRIVDVEFIAADGRFITMHAKVARGLMARWMIDNRVERIDDMRGFDADGYAFDASASSSDNWVFQNKLR